MYPLPLQAAFLFPIFGLGGLFSLVYFIFWLWALIDCLNGRFPGNDKVVWLAVIIFLPLIGSILYLAVGRNRRMPPGPGGFR